MLNVVYGVKERGGMNEFDFDLVLYGRQKKDEALTFDVSFQESRVKAQKPCLVVLNPISCVFPQADFQVWRSTPK